MDPHVYSIGDRPGYLPTVFFYHMRHALTPRASREAARAGVEGRDEHETRGEDRRAFCAGDRDMPIFERFAQGVHDIAMKFREFIGEEDAAVRERHFTGPEHGR